ncbi:long-chain-fatty-acid--CoA ligase [bacterium BMS3Bbin03]|nr:long-chain-fatty-acid--CoA ligase [bacterium BMS3Bbin03]
MTVPELLERAGLNIPDKEAIVYGSKRLSYRQFDELANRMANALIKQGVKKGDKVAMWMFNSDAFAVAYFGILKAGAVAVPINFKLIPAEVAYIVHNSDAVSFIYDDVFQEGVNGFEKDTPNVKTTVCAGEKCQPGKASFVFEEILETSSPDHPGVKIDRFDHSDIIYTSGTTGRPKGALFMHDNLVMEAAHFIPVVGLNEEDRILHVAPLFHSAELHLYFVPGIFLGSTHVILHDFIPNKVLETIQNEKITQFFGVPTMYLYLMHLPNFDDYDLSSMKFYGYGAAPMPAESVRQMIKKFKTENFFSLCGFTEAGPGGVALKPKDQVRKAGAGGGYIHGMEFQIVDDNWNPVPTGQIGEFVVRGPMTMKEYYKSPEANAQTVSPEGWIRSGDLAFEDEEGIVTLVDRKKDMIISGGENVYSKEVEDAIALHPAVMESAIIGVPHPVFGETVTAIIVLKPDQTLTEKELLTFLEDKLAQFKCPRILKIVESLPHSASGKVLKRELREQYKSLGKSK